GADPLCRAHQHGTAGRHVARGQGFCRLRLPRAERHPHARRTHLVRPHPQGRPRGADPRTGRRVVVEAGLPPPCGEARLQQRYLHLSQVHLSRDETAGNMGMTRDARPFVIFLLAFLAFAHFCQQEMGNVQQYTRLALSMALIEGHVDIDRYGQANPRADLAFVDGHYYADKVPGLSLVAVPAIAATRLVLGLLGRPTDLLEPSAFAVYTVVAILTTTALFGALAAAACYNVARRLGASERRATAAAFILALGT